MAWRLSEHQSDAFVRELLDPREPNARLRAAAARYMAAPMLTFRPARRQTIAISRER